MTKKELMKLSQRELFKACRNQDLDTSGTKAELADRLIEAQPKPEISAPEEKGTEESGTPEAPPAEVPPDETPPDETPPAED